VRALVLDDFERRRRIRETSNERVVCIVVAVSVTSLLLSQLAWNVLLARDRVPTDQVLVVSWEVLAATGAALVAHLAVLGLLTVWPGYDPRRKYALVAMRVALMGFMCWAQWFNHSQVFGLLVPSIMFMMVIVLTGLTFSRLAVLVTGGLSILVYSAVTMLGPAWPMTARACVLSAQAFGFATAITYCIVDGMLRLHRESVASEHLSRFFAPEIAARIAAEPDVTVRATEARVTVLFVDISGFTEMSSSMTPQQVVDLLNAYFPPMVEIVFRHSGMLEKFIGDAILAVWGAPFGHPDDADRAVRAAIEMQQGVAPLNDRLIAAGHRPIAIHIGLCSGPVAAGYIGTESYVQYAAIGDTTNVASRICSVAGAGEILVAESTRLLLTRPGIVLEPVPPVAVKGKAEPLVLHRVCLPPAA
ncbi:MAG: adenylate/guanylate cyclase domain-containing protein, partial [Planctomycetia bacterium]